MQWIKSPLAIFLLLLLGGSVAGLGFLYCNSLLKPESIEMELAKALLQIGVVSGVAAVISILISNHERDQRRLENRDELLRTMLKQTMVSYNSVKIARRLLRARGLIRRGDDETIAPAAYDDCIGLIMDSQLAFESLKDDAKTNMKTFTDAPQLLANFRSLEKYLNNIIDEYEDNYPELSGEDPAILRTDLPYIDRFLMKAQFGFKNNFSSVFENTKNLIRKDLQPAPAPAPANGGRSGGDQTASI